MADAPIFKSFSEYWYYARSLSENQRRLIFKSLSNEQKDLLDDSYRKDGWSDTLFHNEISGKIDDIKALYGYDIFDVRCRVLKGKSVYLPSKFWKAIESQMRQYKPEAVRFVIGGIKGIICDINPEVCLIVKEDCKDLG